MADVGSLSENQDFPIGWTIKTSLDTSGRFGFLVLIEASLPGSSYAPLEATMQIGIQSSHVKSNSNVASRDAVGLDTIHERFSMVIDSLGYFFIYAYKGCRLVPGAHHEFDGDPSELVIGPRCVRCDVRKAEGAVLFGINRLKGETVIPDRWVDFLAKDAILRPVATLGAETAGA